MRRMMDYVLGLGLGLATCVAASADPYDEAYYRTFQIDAIGAWGNHAASTDYPNGIGDALEYKTQMLQGNNNVNPKNVKIGLSDVVWPQQSTTGSYYDYIYNPGEIAPKIDEAHRADLTMGFHVNVTPWGDTNDQSVDILSNYLEKYNNGAYLQKDTNGNIRRPSVAQDPTLTEVYDGFADHLEMQLTMSRNATGMMSYLQRNVQESTAFLNWYRQNYPDVLSFVSASSEYQQRTAGAGQTLIWCDYSDYSKQDFRDWLSGAGNYVGQAQYASLSAFNSAFSGASGFPYASWSAVQPPTTPVWTTTANGRWWQKWHAFRKQQLQIMEQIQFNWMKDTGWSADRIYGHQVPFNPSTTSNSERSHASDWTSTFCINGSNGVTTYGSNASSATIFSALYSNDKNWGIFEYNPLSSTKADNLSALNTVWNNYGHIICPYLWAGQASYEIRNSTFSQAIQQFVADKNSSNNCPLAPWEVAPDARDMVWAMSESDDVESTNHISSLTFSGGQLSGTVTSYDPFIYFEENEAAHAIPCTFYNAVSFRLYLDQAGPGQFFYFDFNGNFSSIDFTGKAGWNVYRIDLGDQAGWLNNRFSAIRLDLPPTSGASYNFKLDWVRLHANPSWHLENALEYYGASNINSLSMANSSLSGTDANGDGYFYLSTDKRDTSGHADRAFIDTSIYKKIRVYMYASAAASAQIYWWKDWNGATPYATSFPVSAGWNMYTVDMTNVSDWTGLVTRFRFDPVNTTGVSFSVDQIYLQPVMLEPLPGRPTMVHNTPSPLFRWTGPVEPNHTVTGYDFQVATDFYFTNVTYSLTNYANEGVQLANANWDGAFWWRVRTRDSAGAISPWSVPLPFFMRTWQGTNTADFLVQNNLATPTVSSGVWQSSTTGGDPYLAFNTGTTLDASFYSTLKLRMKLTGSGDAPAQVFFFPTSGGFYTVDFTAPRDGAFHDYSLNLAANSGWTGDISQLRLDPDNQSGTSVEIDSAWLE